jgi:hypothetical protein
MGRSIGVQEKSVSGDREPPRAAPSPPPRQRSAPEPKRAAPKPAGRPANYDGAWLLNNMGCGGSAGRVWVSGGRISGDGGVTGSVSANGIVSTRTSVSVGWGGSLAIAVPAVFGPMTAVPTGGPLSASSMG